MQQLSKGHLNSYDLETTKSLQFQAFFKIFNKFFEDNNQKIKNCTEDALFYYKKQLVDIFLFNLKISYIFKENGQR